MEHGHVERGTCDSEGKPKCMDGDGIKHSIKTEGDYTIQGKVDLDLGDLRSLAMRKVSSGRCSGRGDSNLVQAGKPEDPLIRRSKSNLA